MAIAAGDTRPRQHGVAKLSKPVDYFLRTLQHQQFFAVHERDHGVRRLLDIFNEIWVDGEPRIVRDW